MGARVRCEKCTKSGGDLIHIDDFLNVLNEKIGVVEGKEKDNLEEFEKFSNPLELMLNNYKDQFNSTVQLIINEVQKVKHQIHEYFSIFNNPLESQSLSQFESVCHKVCSNVFDQFDLKSQYKQLIYPIKQLINVQEFYSDKLKTCFKQLQNDMTNYEPTYNFNVQGRVCTAMSLGQCDDTQMIAMALENQLRIYELVMEKKKVIERQCFKHFTHNIASVVFSEDNKYLVAGGTYDKRMNIYVECETKKKEYQLKAEIIYENPIYSIIFTSNNEDLISASGNDLFCINNADMKTIINIESQEHKRIQILEQKSKYLLNFSHNNTVYQLDYQIKEKQKFISCSYDKQIFIWEKKLGDWNVLNKIRVQNSVYRCSFVGDDTIVVQENSSRHLTFYKEVSNQQQANQKYEFYDLNTDLSHNFPIIYLESPGLLIVKHNSKIVFFRKRGNGIFYKEDEKNGEIGTITFDAQFYLSWEKEKQKVVIYQQMDKFQATKQLFEERYSQKQFKTNEEKPTQNLYQTTSQQESQLSAQNTNVINKGLNSNDIKVEIKNDIKVEVNKDIKKEINNDIKKEENNYIKKEIKNDNLLKDIKTDDRMLVDLDNSDSLQLVQFT
ncbi:unnamed protein product (macronuclear) [Paramecium tetraurelia]|uniref:Anaphase-promoting complex subunit 4 WD40 domain-containing protein n=1 Tax=Paramecium tetraurelia TaxID=5888 RepID=A0E6R2_PARTE|nr:uncharacterized protein GSPATT00023707001 [Paramecium tetraurelia]CAK90979.1 unnamed protein product [Paramecium tetraurelia]|eukprot:XP_001458376.1 hypothetical protein (macronuclear) [Paramecium tetraurelia strain d4-2]